MDGKIIEEFKLGNTTIKINDAYIRTEKSEIDKILKNIADIVINSHLRKED